MALISCPECESGVSNRALFCPKCGCPIEKYARRLACSRCFGTGRVKAGSTKERGPDGQWRTVHSYMECVDCK